MKVGFNDEGKCANEIKRKVRWVTCCHEAEAVQRISKKNRCNPNPSDPGENGAGCISFLGTAHTLGFPRAAEEVDFLSRYFGHKE